MISLSEKRAINKAMREKDESKLWPIRNAFNVTERAIRQAKKFAQVNGEFGSGFEYESFLEGQITRIVNDPRNH